MLFTIVLALSLEVKSHFYFELTDILTFSPKPVLGEIWSKS